MAFTGWPEEGLDFLEDLPHNNERSWWLANKDVLNLPEDRRQVVLLRFGDGLSSREIGAILDRSEGAVRVLLHRALRDLAARLGV